MQQFRVCIKISFMMAEAFFWRVIERTRLSVIASVAPYLLFRKTTLYHGLGTWPDELHSKGKQYTLGVLCGRLLRHSMRRSAVIAGQQATPLGREYRLLANGDMLASCMTNVDNEVDRHSITLLRHSQARGQLYRPQSRIFFRLMSVRLLSRGCRTRIRHYSKISR